MKTWIMYSAMALVLSGIWFGVGWEARKAMDNREPITQTNLNSGVLVFKVVWSTNKCGHTILIYKDPDGDLKIQHHHDPNWRPTYPFDL